MSRRSTEDLVAELAREVPPVRPIPALRFALLGVLGAWAIAVASMWIFGRSASELARGLPWGDAGFVAVLAGLALLALGATLAALAGAVPGREGAAHAAGVTGLIGVAVAAGAGLWGVFAAAGPTGAAGVAGSFACMSHAGALALLPVLVASHFLARGFTRRPYLSAGCAVAGTVALGGVAVHASCRAGDALHALLGHALPPLVLGLALAIPMGLLVHRWSRSA